MYAMLDRPSDVPCRKAASGTRRVHALVLTLALVGLDCANAKVGGVGPLPDGSTQPPPPNSDSAVSPPGCDAAITQPATGACDPLTNTGCPSDQKCTALQQSNINFALGCVPIGNKVAGEACTQEVFCSTSQTGDDCGSGLACFILQGDASATCHRLCNPTGAATGCMGTDTCSQSLSGITSVQICVAATSTQNPDSGTTPTQPCQPLEQTGCSTPGQACYLSSTTSLCMTAGSKTPGGSCGPINDCAKGGTCVAGTCRSFCSMASAGSCTGANTGGPKCDNAAKSTVVEANLGFCN
jgi:hypothetical protein